MRGEPLSAEFTNHCNEVMSALFITEYTNIREECVTYIACVTSVMQESFRHLLRAADFGHSDLKEYSSRDIDRR